MINEHTHKTCKGPCGQFKRKISFAFKVGKKDGYRRNVCNSCHRAKIEAKKIGITVTEYLLLSNGPCVLCGQPDCKAYFYQSGVTRVCGKHRMELQFIEDAQKLLTTKLILQQFPFWLNFLKDRNLYLFRLETMPKTG